MGEILVMFLALGEDVGSRMFPPPPPLPPLLLPSMPVLLLPDFLKSGTELTTQKYSTNLGTFSLSRALESLVMRRRVSADPPGLLLLPPMMFVLLLVRARLRSSPILLLLFVKPSWLDVRVRALSGPTPLLPLLPLRDDGAADDPESEKWKCCCCCC